METFPALLAHCEGNPPVTGHHWRWTLMFSLICAGTNSWANNRDAGDLRHHRAHHDVTVADARKSYWNMRVWWQNSIRNFMIRTYIVCKVRVILVDPQRSVNYIGTNDSSVYWSMYTSHGFDELILSDVAQGKQLNFVDRAIIWNSPVATMLSYYRHDKTIKHGQVLWLFMRCISLFCVKAMPRNVLKTSYAGDVNRAGLIIARQSWYIYENCQIWVGMDFHYWSS